MKKICSLISILTIVLSLQAQNQETVFGYSGIKLTGAWGGPSFALSGIGENNAYLRGGFGGLEFNKSIYVAYAGYWLNEKAELPQFTNEKVDFSYSGLLLGYAFKSNKMVHPKIAILTAGGKVDVNNEELDKVFVLQPTAGVGINVFKWWHIDVLGGYRIVTGTDLSGLSDSDVSAPFGEINFVLESPGDGIEMDTESHP